MSPAADLITPLPPAAAAADPSPSQASLDRLKDALNKTFRLTIADGRSFTGTLVCLDKELNLILSNTTEVNAAGDDRDVGMVCAPPRDSSPLGGHSRLTTRLRPRRSQVMVPWKWVVDAQVELEDKRSWTERFAGSPSAADEQPVDVSDHGDLYI